MAVSEVVQSVKQAYRFTVRVRLKGDGDWCYQSSEWHTRADAEAFAAGWRGDPLCRAVSVEGTFGPLAD